MKNEIIFSRFHIVYWRPGCVSKCFTIVDEIDNNQHSLLKRLNVR